VFCISLRISSIPQENSAVANVISPAPAKGTQPEGTRTEADASRKVREMFTQIAPSYDSLNHILSLQLDRLWRHRTAKRLRPILQRQDAVVLDLCCGTGDLSLALRKAGQAQIIGADFAHTMLTRARAKSLHAAVPSSTKIEKNVIPSEARNPLSSDGHDPGESWSPDSAANALPLVEADALRLPFADQSFDLVTTAFGFRNLANYDSGLREIHRILKPGGTLAILEFTEPPAGPLGNLYRWYFRTVLPRIGGWLSGDPTAYTYLPKSVSRFFRPPELAAAIAAAGYTQVTHKSWTAGTVALHIAQREA
jgi:demethylmenaquinone methyltransferase/2-methoxy-6-polyprenyl-1,4-benzoquinol methylase